MAPSTTKTSLSITHIGTATAVLEFDGVNLLTDPFFSPAGSSFDLQIVTLLVEHDPALHLDQLPPIDGVLLSHEDHVDNLDDLGRTLLNGRHVLTTMDGAQKLAPRPGVHGLQPWERITLSMGGKQFNVTATPCQHLPGGESTGFLVQHPDGSVDAASGLPNAIWFAGDTVYFPELREIRNKFHVTAAVLNLGSAHVDLPDVGRTQITMDGKQGAQAVRELGADFLVPMHYDSWHHFTQHGDELRKAFEEEGVLDKVCWLVPGKPVKIF
ncbi:N-acyl-phosphatidylethanolamine-hydrolyzing phospholipase D [Lasiodiplodia theobromae]|uniref:N-acyl-phosphatidylethanolamine-hydrolyzing phospholipase D n=1 Tax=Lasiodiplodia theobromae TaxID=45133 RepID=A0A5N5DFQ6_9PEZI|nr:N-acyl-phosphatidylethanolamine-hydrolyzing phospholipase D [Lasiodiplodia theobromae]